MEDVTVSTTLGAVEDQMEETAKAKEEASSWQEFWENSGEECLSPPYGGVDWKDGHPAILIDIAEAYGHQTYYVWEIFTFFLRVVAPYAGAWIETNRQQKNNKGKYDTLWQSFTNLI